MKKKNILLFSLIFFAIFLIIAIVFGIDVFSYYHKYSIKFENLPIVVLRLHLSFPLYQMIIMWVMMFVAIPLGFSATLFALIRFIKSSNFVRYTYEEYKAYRTKKKAEKQAKEKAKLQEKLDKLQKTE